MVGAEAPFGDPSIPSAWQGIRKIARETGRRGPRCGVICALQAASPRATELDPFKDYVIKRLNGGAGAAATERAADRAARVGLSPRLCVKSARFVTSAQIALPDRYDSHSQILSTSVPGEPLLAVRVIYSPATAKRPTPGTASIGRSGRIQYVMTMANSNRQTETANGSVQLPVRSRLQAKAMGERIPATAPEAFISELEVPA